MQKLTRYSPGGFGAMIEDDQGDYVRLSDVRDLLRWRKLPEEVPTEEGDYLCVFKIEDEPPFCDVSEWRKESQYRPKAVFLGESRTKRITHWRPIGPMPEGEKP